MNGAVFANLLRLVIVDLRGNVCIDKYFETERAPSIFRRRISTNCASTENTEKEISCKDWTECGEIMDEVFYRFYNRTSGCCRLEFGTHFDSPEYEFIQNTNYTKLEILYIVHQQNIEFLSVSVYERFPNLKFFAVVNTPVQKISKKNFENMYELSMLHLERNQIEIIRSDTFEDLINLKEIYIGLLEIFAKF